MLKILKAYMDEEVWPPNPTEAKQHALHKHWPNMGAYLPSMIWVVIVLLQQCGDQLKIGLP